MKIILGAKSDGAEWLNEYKKHNFGRMLVRYKFKPYENEPWGFDNGAFIDWSNKKSFDEYKYNDMLEYVCNLESKPYLAVVPDIVAGGNHSLDFSMKWLDKLPKDFNWYLALQDNMNTELVKQVLCSYSGLFLGGTNLFKYTAHIWCKLAHDNNLKFHYGRCGTIKKVESAEIIGVDSIDSSFPLWTKERFFNFIKFVTRENKIFI